MKIQTTEAAKTVAAYALAIREAETESERHDAWKRYSRYMDDIYSELLGDWRRRGGDRAAMIDDVMRRIYELAIETNANRV